MGADGSGERRNLALSCGVKDGAGDNEVERLEFGDRWATGAREEGPGSGRSSVVTWVMRGAGRKGRTVGPPREMEDPSRGPAHSPPHIVTDAKHQPDGHTPLLTRFSGHKPWAGTLLASSLKPPLRSLFSGLEHTQPPGRAPYTAPPFPGRLLRFLQVSAMVSPLGETFRTPIDVPRRNSGPRSSLSHRHLTHVHPPLGCNHCCLPRVDANECE